MGLSLRRWGRHGSPDIMILSLVPIQPLCLVPARVIGVMRMVDQGLADEKILAVAEHDASVGHLKDVKELPPHFTLELGNS